MHAKALLRFLIVTSPAEKSPQLLSTRKWSALFARIQRARDGRAPGTTSSSQGVSALADIHVTADSGLRRRVDLMRKIGLSTLRSATPDVVGLRTA